MKNLVRPKFARQGFALIVTLTLMILLTVIAVGLLTLSSITLRSSGQMSAANQARSNAKLAMILALGELQATLGVDTSVSAPASSVMSGAGRPHLTGAWQKPQTAATTSPWHWTPTASGQPPYAQKASLFKGWLVSAASQSAATSFTLPATAPAVGANVINLVGDPKLPLSNNGNSNVINADKVKVGSTTRLGKYAWAVFDESTKASIQLAGPTTNPTAGEEIASRSVPSRVRADILNTNLAPSLATPVNMLSLETAVIPAGTKFKDEFVRRFHDFTTDSRGLLTDTANGGLKTDLTSIFEEEGTSYPTGAFTAPNETSPYAFPGPDPTVAGAVSWNYLRDHYRKYRTVTASGGELLYRPTTSSDLKINSLGVTASPDTERLLPVIAKFQMVFSIVSHYPYLLTRRKQLDENGVPKGYQNYGVPNIVYDPIITLYNPYDVALDLTKLRVRIWDPPVGFRFKKMDRTAGTSAYFRPNDKDKDGNVRFRGLANFRDKLETDDNYRKCFTMILTNGTPAASGVRLKLLPGEVKVYSARVESNWTWTMEAGDGSTDNYPTRSFFDYGGRNYANIDGRTPTGIGQYGIETVPGWDTRAGFQTDHLSNAARDTSTLYEFERLNKVPAGGFVNLRATDDVVVEAKPLVTKGAASKSFQIDILAGLRQGAIDEASVNRDASNSGVATDRLRSYSFNFADALDPAGELVSEGSDPIVSREFNVRNILQGPAGETGKKKPFAMLEVTARTTKDDSTDTKPWLYNNPVVEGAAQTSSTVGVANQSYDLRFREMTSFSGFPNGIDIDGNPRTNRGFFGASGSTLYGSSFVNMMHVPVAPSVTLGDLVHSNLVSSSTLPRVTHAFGNARAHPLIPASSVSQSLGGQMLDHSYLLNDGLWDTYYFSSITDYVSGKGAVDKNRTRKEVLTDLLSATKPAPNNRLVSFGELGTPKVAAEEIDALTAVARSKQLAKHLAVIGPFNLSSTSVDAWRAVLSSLRDRSVYGGKVNDLGTTSTISSTVHDNTGLTPFTRSARPLADSTADANIRWAAYRVLTDQQITNLANSIVTEIVKRGKEDKAPAFSLGEFVNRRIGSAGNLHTLAGLLQTAIDNSDINDVARGRDSRDRLLSATEIPAVRKAGSVTTEVMSGYSAEGAPSMITQGDLMSALAAVATVRGDTFKIRSYGEATAPNGTTVTARAWCETVVQRVPAFVDPTDLPETPIADLKSPANKLFGRRFNVVSFRWLNENEI